ncbi:DUF4082 domain-containing protein, partial [uncultured Azohydromonas sp.]|uniref:DUF4082 domain-containing protein n=1 Tax=uncultured Azohydromonas sp. TaxID=487342 RepID=UPI002613E5BE
VAASLSYDPTTRTATLTPFTALAASTTYTATLRGGGTDPRIKDASGNPMTSSVTWSFTTAAASAENSCPCNAWSDTATPTNASINDTSAVELGVKFRVDVDGFITGVRFYKGTGNTGTHIGNLWSLDGTRLATAPFTSETATGWQQVNFATPVPVSANTVYVASYYAPNGRYAGDSQFFSTKGVDNAPVHLLQNGVNGGNGVFAYGSSSSFPSEAYQATNYWVDVVFSPAPAGPDTTAPTVTGTSPANAATGVPTTSSITATFSEAVDPATVGSSTFELRSAGGTLVPATVTYNAASRTATLTPGASLAASTAYTATVRGGGTDPRVKDLAGNALASSVTWSFTTAVAPTVDGCPCNAWSDTATPTNASVSDTSAVELGVKFRVDVDGFITGVRFYKGTGNTGTHIGNLWSLDGTRLATAPFTSETATGWQQVNFATPVPVSANTVYVASYYAPNGRYAGDSQFFSTKGVDNAPVHLLQNGVNGGNGVFAYGSSSSFPSETYQAANYWVDVVFSPTPAPAGPDTMAPTATFTAPAAGASVLVNSSVTITGTASDAGGGVVGVVEVSTDNGATWHPASGSSTWSYTWTPTVAGPATILARAVDDSGNIQSTPASRSVTVGAMACPCSAFTASETPAVASQSDSAAVNLGVKFRVTQNGYITGIRFYKGPDNTGLHVGALWSSDGTLLASAPFLNETATGWQQVNFLLPVPVTANTVYVASYRAPNGGYAVDYGYFAVNAVTSGPIHLLANGESGANGVFTYGGTTVQFPSSSYQSSNYWVDVVFTPSP